MDINPNTHFIHQTNMLDRTIQPSINPLTDFDIQKPKRVTLPNGVTLNILHAGEEEVVRMDILINAGIWHQELPLQALFTNRMLREGTQSLDSATISERLDFYGAWIELSSSMNCNFLTLYSLNKHLPYTLPIVSEMIKAPTFPEAEMQVAIETNRQHFLVNSTKVDVMARKTFSQALFGPNHPCGRHAVIEDYANLTTKHLHDFYRRHYHSGNCSIYLSGKISDSIIRLIEKELGSENWGEMKSPQPLTPLITPAYEGKRIFIEHPSAVQSALRIGFPLMDRTHEDFMPMKVLVTVLGGYFGSRLMSNIREQKGYTYNIYATIASYPFQGYLTIGTETGNEYVEPCIQEIRHELQRLKDELIPEQELSMVKNYMMGEMCRGYEGSFSLSEAWIFTQTAGLDDDFYARMGENIRQVSRKKLQDLAVKYFQPENLLEIVAGKKM